MKMLGLNFINSAFKGEKFKKIGLKMTSEDFFDD